MPQFEARGELSGGSTDILRKCHVMMIGYCDTLETPISARLYEHDCIRLSIGIYGTFTAGPVAISRRVDLQITLIVVRSFISARDVDWLRFSSHGFGLLMALDFCLQNQVTPHDEVLNPRLFAFSDTARLI